MFVDLANGPDGTFNFIIAPGRMEQPPEKRERFNTTVAGWYVPPMPTAPFLEAYSRAGGTHHGALVYGGCTETLAAFGRLMGWTVTVIS